jgi:sugar phosphate isomerase/epimerase
MKIAAQLYTVREFTQTDKDFKETIKKVAAIGYPGVQLSAHGPIPAQFIADTCAEYGVEIVNTHSPPPRILNDTDNLIAEHKLYKATQIGIGSMPTEYRGSVAGIKKFAEDYLPAAKKIKDSGLRFAYHNHAFEFVKFDGKLMLDYIVEAFAEADIQVILDTYWVQAGGADPAFWIRKLSGRVPRIHFKDMTIEGQNEQRFAPIGSGNLNWPAIIEACRASAVEWAIVEQDNSYDKDAFDCLAESYKFLAK